MKRIYQAANNIEAHMLVHLLAQSDIQAHVEGEHLQSGVGELPAGGLAAVVVDDDDAIRARKIIEEWEAKSPPPASDTATDKPWLKGSVAAFVVGAAISGLGVWSIYSGPVNEADGIDYDGDGRVDERYFYRGNLIERFEVDRNRDGKADDIVENDSNAIARKERLDNDFDGRMESTVSFRHGLVFRYERDANGDGRVDYREEYTAGVITRAEYFNLETGKLAKRVEYLNGDPVRAELDLDGDGVFEMSYGYGLYDEPSPN